MLTLDKKINVSVPTDVIASFVFSPDFTELELVIPDVAKVPCVVTAVAPHAVGDLGHYNPADLSVEEVNTLPGLPPGKWFVFKANGTEAIARVDDPR